MIPNGILKHGDYLLWKTNRKTFWFTDIGGVTEPLNERICKINNTDVLCGYNHIVRVDRNINFILEATPPRCVRSELTPKYWKKITKRADIEIYRFSPALTEEQQNHITDETYKLANLKWNKRKLKFIGLKYDWWALILAPLSLLGLFGGLNSRSRLHCAELVFNAALCENIILSSQGRFDPLVSPNNCINSGLLHKIYTIRR